MCACPCPSHLGMLISVQDRLSSPHLMRLSIKWGELSRSHFVFGTLRTCIREGKVWYLNVQVVNLYPAHADDVKTVATAVRAAEEQSVQVSKFASHQGLTLNKSKTEVVKFSSNTISRAESINLVGSPIAVISLVKCLGYTWNRSLSAKPAVKGNIIARAGRQFFALASTGCYLGHSNCLLCSGNMRISHSPLSYGAGS